MTILKNPFFILYFIFLFRNVAKAFEIINEDFFVFRDEKDCKKNHFLFFHEKLYKICLYTETINLKHHKYNIFVQRKEGNIWKETQLLKNHSEIAIHDFFSYLTDNQMIIVFCYKQNHLNNSFRCFRSSSYDGIKFEKAEITIPHNEDNIDINGYSVTPLETFGKQYLLFCGLKNQGSDDEHVFIICYASNDDGISWGTKLDFYYSRVKTHKYSQLKPKIHNRQLGFLFIESTTSSDRIVYINCRYRNYYDYYCYRRNLSKEDTEDILLQDFAIVNGHYLTIHTNKNHSKCYLKSLSKDYFLFDPIKNETGNNFCYPHSIIKLSNSKFCFIYHSGLTFYVYVFLHLGYNEHCTLSYVKDGKNDGEHNPNPGFFKNNDLFTCNVRYNMLIVDGDDRYLILGVIGELHKDAKLDTCFKYSYHDSLTSIFIHYKIDFISGKDEKKLYIFRIKKGIEDSFYYHLRLSCDLGDGFFINLILDYNKQVYIHNISTHIPSMELHAGMVLMLDKDASKNWEDIFKERPYNAIGSYVSEHSMFIKFNSIKKTEKYKFNFLEKKETYVEKEINFHKGDSFLRTIGVDFSNLSDSYEKHAIVENDKIKIDVQLHEGTRTRLGVICPIDGENICFEKVFHNGQIVEWKKFFQEEDGDVTLFPRIFSDGTDKESQKGLKSYVEDILILEESYVDKYLKNRDKYKNNFVCKCKYNNKTYEIIFTLI